MDKIQCYILADMNWASGKIIRKYFEDWKILRAEGPVVLYKNTKTDEIVTTVDYTGSKLNPKKFKNRVLTCDKETAHGLVELLMDKTNIRLVSQT
jgi:hypothetical protein